MGFRIYPTEPEREQTTASEHCYAMSPTPSARPAQQPAGWRSLSDLPDDRLVELAREHNLLAFEALMRRHNRRLFRVTRSVLRDGDAAQDAVQETYLRAFTQARQLSTQRQVRRVDHARGVQRSADDAPAYARRHGLARRRRRRRTGGGRSRGQRRALGGPIPRSGACARAARARHRRAAGELPHGVRAARGRRPGCARNRGVPRRQRRHGAHPAVPRAAPAARRAVAPAAGRKHRDFRFWRGALRRRGGRRVRTPPH